MKPLTESPGIPGVTVYTSWLHPPEPSRSPRLGACLRAQRADAAAKDRVPWVKTRSPADERQPRGRSVLPRTAPCSRRWLARLRPAAKQGTSTGSCRDRPKDAPASTGRTDGRRHCGLPQRRAHRAAARGCRSRFAPGAVLGTRRVGASVARHPGAGGNASQRAQGYNHMSEAPLDPTAPGYSRVSEAATMTTPMLP
jgi:hypothetical protein